MSGSVHCAIFMTDTPRGWPRDLEIAQLTRPFRRESGGWLSHPCSPDSLCDRSCRFRVRRGGGTRHHRLGIDRVRLGLGINGDTFYSVDRSAPTLGVRTSRLHEPGGSRTPAHRTQRRHVASGHKPRYRLKKRGILDSCAAPVPRPKATIKAPVPSAVARPHCNPSRSAQHRNDFTGK